MTQADLVKIYDDLLPEMLQRYKRYREEVEPDEEAAALNHALSRRVVAEGKKLEPGRHSETLTTHNVDALVDDQVAHDEVVDAIARRVLRIARTSDDLASFNLSRAGDDEADFDVVREALNEALKRRAISKLSSEMPDVIYRGAADGDPVTTGFEGVEEAHPETPDAAASGRVVFVTSEPSVAASYARKDRFARNGILPSNYGDYVYRIRTAGLDPKLFMVDQAGNADEMLFGPQYRYNAPIPQEEVEIVDQAGNKRKVPRIEKVPYLSDERCKDVYAPAHLIDAVRRRI